jgi:hypothetical protein
MCVSERGEIRGRVQSGEEREREREREMLRTGGDEKQLELS